MCGSCLFVQILHKHTHPACRDRDGGYATTELTARLRLSRTEVRVEEGGLLLALRLKPVSRPGLRKQDTVGGSSRGLPRDVVSLEGAAVPYALRGELGTELALEVN